MSGPAKFSCGVIVGWLVGWVVVLIPIVLASENTAPPTKASTLIHIKPPKVITYEATKDGILLSVTEQQTGAFVWIDTNADNIPTKDEIHKVYFWKSKNGELNYTAAWRP